MKHLILCSLDLRRLATLWRILGRQDCMKDSGKILSNLTKARATPGLTASLLFTTCKSRSDIHQFLAKRMTYFFWQLEAATHKNWGFLKFSKISSVKSTRSFWCIQIFNQRTISMKTSQKASYWRNFHFNNIMFQDCYLWRKYFGKVRILCYRNSLIGISSAVFPSWHLPN